MCRALVRTDDKPAAVVASAMAGPYTGLPSDPMLAAKAELEQVRRVALFLSYLMPKYQLVTGAETAVEANQTTEERRSHPSSTGQPF